MSEPDPDDNRRGPLLALLVIAGLLFAGLWLFNRLSTVGSLQDCVATGRHDCTRAP